MVKRGKKLKSVKHDREDSEEEVEQAQLTKSKSPIKLSSDDDEANEDLSLRIVKRAMLRACNNPQDDALFEESKSVVSVIDLSSPPSPPPPHSMEYETIEKANKKNRRTNIEVKEDPVSTEIYPAFRDFCSELLTVDEAKGDKNMEIVKLAETNPVEKADNGVLRKLLRGPRYFDPPDGGWGTCYNCGEDGHSTVNCTSAKRKKPCYICCSLEHHARECLKLQNCYICTKGGHRAKDCPEKYKDASKSFKKLCLKCGDSRHDMFSCKNDYLTEDLKEVQCYVCKSFGHLCCANNTDIGPREVSCYRCGQPGHTGLTCRIGKSCKETTGTEYHNSCYVCGEEGHFARECPSSTKACRIGKSCKETTGTEYHNSCYVCGEEGHFARACPSSTKVGKRNCALSTPQKRLSREDKDVWEIKSVPRDFGKAHKKKKQQYGGIEFTTTPKLRNRGGWIPDDQEDLFFSKTKANGWNSPTTPMSKNNRIFHLSSVSRASTSGSSRKPGKLCFGNSSTNPSDEFYKHRYSASRFANSSSGGMRRYHEW